MNFSNSLLGYVGLPLAVSFAQAGYRVTGIDLDQRNMAALQAGKAVKGSRVLVLGVAYKKNVSDLRQSPALDIIHLLAAKGAQVDYHDPHAPSFRYEGMAMTSVADCVVVATDHDEYDWAAIQAAAAILIDTRRALRRLVAKDQPVGRRL